jgi:hypothetical protein
MTNFDPTTARQPDQPIASGTWAPPAEEPEESLEEARKNYSWGRNLPALRLNRPPESEKSQRPRAAPAVYRLKPPWYLRPVRLLLGVGLLAAAWGLAMVQMAWVQSIWNHIPQVWLAEWSDVYFALNILGALVLAVATVAIFVIGAFSLLVALIARGW